MMCTIHTMLSGVGFVGPGSWAHVFTGVGSLRYLVRRFFAHLTTTQDGSTFFRCFTSSRWCHAFRVESVGYVFCAHF